MIDIAFIKSQIFHKEDNSRKICSGDVISKEVAEIMMQGKPQDITKCFAPVSQKERVGLYLIEVDCLDCGKTFFKEFGKTQTLYYLSHANEQKYRCNCCNEKFVQLEHKRKLQRKKESEEDEQNCIDLYISSYLNPNCSWKKEVKLYDQQLCIFRRILSNKLNEAIYQKIKEMNYYDFIQTPYWKTISATVKKRAGYRCQLCGETGNLVTHHAIYANHGREHLYKVYSKDLIALCENCHKDFHGIGN